MSEAARWRLGWRLAHLLDLLRQLAGRAQHQGLGLHKAVVQLRGGWRVSGGVANQQGGNGWRTWWRIPAQKVAVLPVPD